MTKIYNYLMENGHLENVYFGELHGDDFAVVEDYDTILNLKYNIINFLDPESITLYKDAGLVDDVGYREGDKGVLDIKINGSIPETLSKALKREGIDELAIIESVLGVEWGYSDEYANCDDCSRLVDTDYGLGVGSPEYYLGDGFVVCRECFNDCEVYQEDYLNERMNDPKKAIYGLMTEGDLEDVGFVELDKVYENGWYGIEDDPKDIYDKLKEDYDEVIFFIDRVEMFHTSFKVFVR